MIWSALALALGLFVRPPIGRASPYVAASLFILSVVWFGYSQGSGPYYRGPTISQLARAVHAPETVASAATTARTESPQAVDTETAARYGVGITTATQVAFVIDYARNGFVLTGGDTNIVPASGARSRAKAVVLGLAATFLPISLLRELSIVRFSGGRALLPVTDLDTVFMDVTFVCAIALLFQRRRFVGARLPFVVFVFALSTITALLLAYVVTNFGTLFRMRPMVAVPLWMLMLAVSESRTDTAAYSRAG
jgi:hypothetical protein